MATFKNPLDQADAILRQARKDTLNKRINQKGNYENFITGGSKSLDNQSRFWDSNDLVKGMTSPGNGWESDEWTHQLNPRYSNPQHEEKKAFHRYTPSTRRGRRASDIAFQRARNGEISNSSAWELAQDLVDKYEGRK